MRFIINTIFQFKPANIFIKVCRFVFLHAVVCNALISCNHRYRNTYGQPIDESQIEKGELLARKYCASCHAFPEPGLLDALHWETGVLPNMAPRLGIFKSGTQFYPSLRNDPFLNKNFYPAKPILSLKEWEQIMAYYVATSPDSLPQQSRSTKIENDLPVFKPLIPALDYSSPAICFVKIDSSNKNNNSIIIADDFKKKIFRLDANLRVSDSLPLKGAVVDMDIHHDSMIICNIGMLNPNNGKFGQAEIIYVTPDGKMAQKGHAIFDSLQRPVQITETDLNRDGKKDFLICEFGFATGALSWMENTGNNIYDHHIISSLPGAIKAYIDDYNHDGLPDLWVLFAQGEEGIFLFTNKGNGEFSSKEVLRFPPIYGSTYFEMEDFNNDGYPDILYTCGDNADFSTVLKPYHGIYIFLNDGKNNFTQKYFFPMNGCFKAMARDFDGDGDLDIAAISFFADYGHQPEEGFVYLENKGDFKFEARTSPQTKAGRWLTMDAGDFDHDGKPDIILGNFSVAPAFIKSAIDWKNGPPFLILKNISSQGRTDKQEK